MPKTPRSGPPRPSSGAGSGAARGKRSNSTGRRPSPLSLPSPPGEHGDSDSDVSMRPSSAPGDPTEVTASSDEAPALDRPAALGPTPTPISSHSGCDASTDHQATPSQSTTPGPPTTPDQPTTPGGNNQSQGQAYSPHTLSAQYGANATSSAPSSHPATSASSYGMSSGYQSSQPNQQFGQPLQWPPTMGYTPGQHPLLPANTMPAMGPTYQALWGQGCSERYPAYFQPTSYVVPPVLPSAQYPSQYSQPLLRTPPYHQARPASFPYGQHYGQNPQYGAPSTEEVALFSNNAQPSLAQYIEAVNYRFSVNETVINFLNNSLQTVETNADGLRAEIVGYTRHIALQDEIAADLRGENKRLTNRIMQLIHDREVVHEQRWSTVHKHMEIVNDWFVYHDNARTVSSLNFRAILDHFQGSVALSVGISVEPPLQFPGDTYPTRHPLDKYASLDWRIELDRHEKEERTKRQKQSGRDNWGSRDSLQVRTDRTRELIKLSTDLNILKLLESDAVIRLLAERTSLIRVSGNTFAHYVCEQRENLQQMVKDNVERLETYEVQGLLFMIEILRPEVPETNRHGGGEA